MGGLLALAFTAGMLAPVNPCGFALLPAWITHTLGDTTTDAFPVRMARALRAGTALTLGFAGTLAAAGLAVSAGARALIAAAPRLGLAVGAALAVLGLVMLTGRGLGLRLPRRAQRPPRASMTTTGMVAAGAGYAAASLSCTFGVLLAVIAQAQATAGWAALLVVFAVYAAGAATVLLLVSLATAAAGTAATRYLAVLARHGTRITAVVLVATGAYLVWYWWPAAIGSTGGAAMGSTAWSAAVSIWIQNHTGTVIILAVAAVAATLAATVVARNTQARHRDATPDNDCCAPAPATIEEKHAR
ncbi:cytochrome c biogenesis protein CcdA [Nocardia cyriacigeorgica]|nr:MULTISPECIES: cytochrome c biogenesis protein CcdA [Mycobacteriales]MBF6080084.1 cytochrome c biogenesis protein CcdA [Nocardia cyriacigeorgica]MBF6090208.1 cytochrome c biogenesis protein CcdA [Nocardia cyriacigeorgica]MBF6094731.1 cytochrome c biogenesis protein CcdA [Nocardia cyriacigeorgica]MBF6098639.1 cytochrome c biogenesis protein CcdA [Nocardia cyriacigeorgica]MBF6162395.1 cytochrome c biogenesis protein CcdA [Nocardia cyriacigeorgica]